MLIEQKMILVGVHRAKTKVFRAKAKGKGGPYQFIGGEMKIYGPDVDVQALAQFLTAMGWCAPENSKKHKEDVAKHGSVQNTTNQEAYLAYNEARQWQVFVQPKDGSAGGADQNGASAPAVSERDQLQRELLDRLANNIRKLDPYEDTHWTSKGLPSLQALEQIHNTRGITRETVYLAIPGYNREVAEQIKEEIEDEREDERESSEAGVSIEK